MKMATCVCSVSTIGVMYYWKTKAYEIWRAIRIQGLWLAYPVKKLYSFETCPKARTDAGEHDASKHCHDDDIYVLIGTKPGSGKYESGGI